VLALAPLSVLTLFSTAVYSFYIAYEMNLLR